ncbi:Hypothetical protein RG1141_CH43070 [Neorhizobium galegae bv. officinalis bv. officinalis str. HAMBI 1141]|uniref:Uncharacterized protein n=1 Tax=Neorhizobium galegae bv. officinalis bv. officinalis str. HAMBI 1141 TaxID=1028801 RepID=A0A068TGN1_NEOGA|nr:Hypothetical protein RG1141_CH43070 [Neorhizobium galegae bv. officinalis bv. officinalis str. HAMBI 1141]
MEMANALPIFRNIMPDKTDVSLELLFFAAFCPMLHRNKETHKG